MKYKYVILTMGITGPEKALKELLCRFLGHLLEQSVVAKKAFDLYRGGKTPQELHQNWQNVFQSLQKCYLHLSASKTVKNVPITSGFWTMVLEKQAHVTLLSLLLVPKPETVGKINLLLGALKVLAFLFPPSPHSTSASNP